jgi:hypothetical protein
MIIGHYSVMSGTLSSKWNEVNEPGARLEYQNWVINIRWPLMLQLQLHVNRYKVGDELQEHIDVIKEGERQFRIQFILRNAIRGGELLCEHFIVNWRWFKIFEPARFKHAVTRVEEGERLLLNFGIRYSFRLIRPCPF